MMGRGNISKDRKIPGKVVGGGGMNFDAGCDLLRLSKSCIGQRPSVVMNINETC